MNAPDEFDRIVGPQFPAEAVDPTPYGNSPHPVKTGLTTRGKAAIAVVGAAMATTCLLGWQHYSAAEAADQKAAAEISYKQQLIELEKLKVLNEASKTTSSSEKTRQAHVDACVKSNKDLVGKTLNSSIQDLVDACQAQYNTSGNSTGADMETTASSHNSGGGGVNDGVLVAGGVLAAGLFAVVRKGRKANAT